MRRPTRRGPLRAGVTTALARLTGGDLDATQDVEVRACPDGPWLVRGAVAVEDAEGVHPVTRPVVAVCSCEKSQRLPWCDGTHKVIPPTTSR